MMFEVDSSMMTAALVFANKQIFFSLLPVIIGPAIWVGGLLFIRLSQLRSDTQQAGKMLDRINGPKDFSKQLSTLDTVIGALASLSVPWRRFRKSLVMPRNDSASSVIRTVEAAEIYFKGTKTGPAACSMYSELAVKMSLSFAILFAGCSLAAGVFLSISGLNFEIAGSETQVVGAFHHGFIQSAVAAVTMFIMTGVITAILMQNFRLLIERSQEKMIHAFTEKLDDLVEPISATMVSYEQTQEVKRQSQYLSLIEKRLTSLESKMIKTVQPGTITAHKPVHTPKLSIPPNLRYEISRFRDPLEDQGQDGPKPTLTVSASVKAGRLGPEADAAVAPALSENYSSEDTVDITK